MKQWLKTKKPKHKRVNDDMTAKEMRHNFQKENNSQLKDNIYEENNFHKGKQILWLTNEDNKSLNGMTRYFWTNEENRW